jgi:cutinase
MNTRDIARILGVAVVMTWTLLTASIAIPSASADPCSDIQVIFARGTNEPPGVGSVGQAFIDSLNSQAGGRSVGVHAVDYPATDDFATSAWVGANDAGSAAQYLVANCPQTKLVLGGYSQGATVIDLSSTAMPPQVADHVAAVALFGNPSSTFARNTMSGGSTLPAISPLYGGKTIDLCVPNDPVCSEGADVFAHLIYVPTGMTSQAATFAASRL